MNYKKSSRLEGLSYAIRGPVYEKALELEAKGKEIIKLNIGNPAPFGFNVPKKIMTKMVESLVDAQGYTHHSGIFEARNAVKNYCQSIGIKNIIDEDVYIGNGVSELIIMCLQALLNIGHEVLVPSPDYPLWTTAVRLAGGRPIHYLCDEQSGWNPDIADIERKISPKTKAIVLINPNNPTGAVYNKEILEKIVALAAKHNLIVFSDEIYDKILFDGSTHTPTASLSDDVFFMTFGGLSKNYRATGFRGGWVTASGAKKKAKSYLQGLNLLASMRLCPNAPAQYLIKTALGGDHGIKDLVNGDGRLIQQRDLVYNKLIEIPGITCTKPKGSLYVFPKIDLTKFSINTDAEFVMGLLTEQNVFLVPGSGFNCFDKSHFRIVFLADEKQLTTATSRIATFLESKALN